MDFVLACHRVELVQFWLVGLAVWFLQPAKDLVVCFARLNCFDDSGELVSPMVDPLV